MHAKSENTIQSEIRRRAFERAAVKQQGHEQTRFTLAALQEVTGLSREELEGIAAEVRAQHEAGRDKFLSIPSQLLLLLAGLAGVGVLAWLIF